MAYSCNNVCGVLQVGRLCKMQTVMDMYVEKRCLGDDLDHVSQLIYLLNGYRAHQDPSKTLESFGVQDGDIVDVMTVGVLLPSR